jgi:ceramide synthetase
VASTCKKTSLSRVEVRHWIREERKIEKFTESCFKMVLFSLASCLGVFVVGSSEWVLRLEDYWKGWPLQPSNLGIEVYYMVARRSSSYLFVTLRQVELGMYVHMLLMHFFERRRKDFVEMVLHHIVTLLLIVFSFLFDFRRIGVVIMLVHDVSDPFLEFAKLANYSKVFPAASHPLLSNCRRSTDSVALRLCFRCVRCCFWSHPPHYIPDPSRIRVHRVLSLLSCG